MRLFCTKNSEFKQIRFHSKAPVRVENPIDDFSVDYIRSNHSLVDRVWVLLPLADGHLEIKMLLKIKKSSTKIAAWCIHSPSPSCDWTHAPTSRSSCRRRGEREARGPLCKWQNFAWFSPTSTWVINVPTCNHNFHICFNRLQVTLRGCRRKNELLQIGGGTKWENSTF